MFRPSIDGRLEELIEEKMGSAGCDKKSEFVRYACRRELTRIMEAEDQ